MKEIVEILMKRDNLTRQEAVDLIHEVQDMLEDAIANGDYSEAEDIMYNELGLEMDYIHYLI